MTDDVNGSQGVSTQRSEQSPLLLESGTQDLVLTMNDRQAVRPGETRVARETPVEPFWGECKAD